MTDPTYFITGEFLAHCCDLPIPARGEIVVVDDVRYLLVRYESVSDRYLASREPRPMYGIVLWRPICSCGYSGLLGSKDRTSAFRAAFMHYMDEHLLPSTVDPVRAIPYVCDAEPYWYA
jgi:hypothetical protein